MSDLDITRKLDTLNEKVDRLSKQLDDYQTPQSNGPSASYHAESGNVVLDTTSGDENKERGNWSNHFDFILACLGYAVGLGNVWRFPYLCYKNGGAVFFIPYVIMLSIVGIPIFFLELSLGQFTSSSPLTCWEMAPFFKGIGVGMVIVSALVAVYYNMIIAWSIYYLFSSFTADLPWQHCNPEWGKPFCSNLLAPDAVNCTDLGHNASVNGVCYRANGTVYGIWNETVAGDNNIRPIIPSEDYFNGYVLGKYNSSGIDDLGGLRWQLILCLLGAWVIVYLSLIKGVKSSGKVVYFTALFPYVVLVILLIRGVTLPGYRDGIRFYIEEVDFEKLKDATVWKDAAVQIFFSLSASWGGLIALASYNKFHNDCLRDSLIVSIGNCLTSFFAGFVIFSFLGFLAHNLQVPVENVVESGIGLAFIVYPDAVTRMPVSPLWSILFFTMLITLGLDSEFALVETVLTSLLDQFPSLRKKKALVLLAICVVFFAIGLVLCTDGGSYVLQLMDTYSGGWNVLVIAFAECICVMYFYGFTHFSRDIGTMLGDRFCMALPWRVVSWWWALCWHVLTPLGVLFILVFSWVKYSPATYGDYSYPVWGDAIGWVLTLCVVCGMIVTGLYQVFSMASAEEGCITALFKPSRFWGPALPQHRAEIRHMHLEPNPWGDASNNQLSYNGEKDNPNFI